MINRELNSDVRYECVHRLLEQGKAGEALTLLKSGGTLSPALRNAMGVCQLRLGHHEMAMWTLRELVFPNGALVMPRQTPAVFLANYATALLLMGDPVMGVSMLQQATDRRHPAIERVMSAVRRWKRGFPWWRRMLTVVGVYPPGAPPLGFEPGELWPPPPSPRGLAA